MNVVSSSQSREADALTSAQYAAFTRLSRLFLEGSGPQIVRMSGPEHRGKTHTVQQFLASMLRASLDSAESLPPLPWTIDSDWRMTRTRLAMPTALIRTTMSWWWTATRVVPDVPNDILGSLRQNALELLSAADSPVAENLGLTADDWLNLVARTTLSVGLDRIPFFGAGAAVARAGREGLRMKSISTADVADELATDLRPNLASDLLLALAVVRLANPNPDLPAIPPLLMLVDEANNLSPADHQQLEQVLAANPDELLSKTTLPTSAQQVLRRLGMPPAFPVTLVLIEDTTTAGESFLGPFGRKRSTDIPQPTHLEQWCEATSQTLRLPTAVIDDFPLATSDEAAAVVRDLLPSLADRDLDMVVRRSADPYLDGHNLALIRAHVQRISLLSNLDDLSPSWIASNLPTHLEAEVEALAGEVSVDSRRALVAGSLLGFGFTRVSVNELLGADQPGVLEEALEAGLISIHGRNDDLPMYVFADHMTYEYFRKLALGDRSLSRTVLTTFTLAKARMTLGWAYPSVSTDALRVAETAKGACWEYRELAVEAGLESEAERAVDVWGAALALTGDRDMIYAEGGDAEARKRLDFLYDIRDRDCAENESLHAWAAIRRWHVHRLTPGAMSYGSLFSMAKAGQAAERPTRTIPEAHQAALDLVARHFDEYPDDLAFGWFDAQLAYRLGPYIRGMAPSLALQAAHRLLYAGLASPTAAHYVASELWHLLPSAERRMCIEELGHWAANGNASDPVRSAALLILRNTAKKPSKAAIELLHDAFASNVGDDMFRDFEVNGSMGDLSAPRVYPWKGIDVTTIYALVVASRSVDIRIGRGKLLHRLVGLAEHHPSAAAIIKSDFAGDLSNKRRRRLAEIQAIWRLTGLLGHSEQGPLPVLQGST